MGKINKMVALDLKKDSWENLFNCIRNSNIEIKGNFWASVQHLEEQFNEWDGENE